MRQAMLVGPALLAAAVFAATADAAPKTLRNDPNLDRAASDVAGFPVSVDYSDNVLEWNEITRRQPTDPYTTFGFTYPLAQPSDSLYDPWDGKIYSVYRIVWMHPSIHAILQTIISLGIAAVPPGDAADALMTLDHEAQHLRLASLDESRVNACALADMPRFLSTDFNTPATRPVTVRRTVDRSVRVRYRKRVRRKLVWRHKMVTKPVVVSTTEQQPNPVYVHVLAGAQQFYESQPARYNSGTCH